MAGRPQERHGLARGAGDRRSPDGAAASLTTGERLSPAARGRPALPAGVARRHLLLAAAASMAILGLSLARAMLLGAGGPSILTGVVFSMALLLPALLSPRFRARLGTRPPASALALGAALGAALLLPGSWLMATGHHTATEVLPAGLLAAWAPAVLLVAAAEEVALRAGIQPWLRAALGPAPAIVLTAVVFAALHYPLYGAIAIPLDLGVGILLGALRQYTGSVSACWLAHGLADLGTWWLP